MCDPYETREFNEKIEKLPSKECKVIITSQCYFATVRPFVCMPYIYAAPFRDTFYVFFFQDCLPDCEETHYTATVSSAPFRSCDHKNLGLTSLCNINGEDSGGMAAIDPPIWGADVINQYREGSL